MSLEEILELNTSAVISAMRKVEDEWLEKNIRRVCPFVKLIREEIEQDWKIEVKLENINTKTLLYKNKIVSVISYKMRCEKEEHMLYFPIDYTIENDDGYKTTFTI